MHTSPSFPPSRPLLILLTGRVSAHPTHLPSTALHRSYKSLLKLSSFAFPTSPVHTPPSSPSFPSALASLVPSTDRPRTHKTSARKSHSRTICLFTTLLHKALYFPHPCLRLQWLHILTKTQKAMRTSLWDHLFLVMRLPPIHSPRLTQTPPATIHPPLDINIPPRACSHNPCSPTLLLPSIRILCSLQILTIIDRTGSPSSQMIPHIRQPSLHCLLH